MQMAQLNEILYLIFQFLSLVIVVPDVIMKTKKKSVDHAVLGPCAASVACGSGSAARWPQICSLGYPRGLCTQNTGGYISLLVLPVLLSFLVCLDDPSPGTLSESYWMFSLRLQSGDYRSSPPQT